MPKQVLLISTLDTKGEESLYLKERLSARGLDPLVMDLSMRGQEPSQAEIDPARVAEAGGSSLEEIRASRERADITNAMIRGGAAIARGLYEEGRLDGVVGLGGSTGSLMATDIMRALPFGTPKLMVSSTAALPGLSTRYIGTGDIALFHTVIEISGLSDLLKNVLDRAAAAMAGQVLGDAAPLREVSGKAIAMTMLGPCERCAASVREALTRKGFQIIGFSAAGVCDRAMEDMIADGLFSGVVDLAPGGVGEHLFGFMRDAGPRRLESAGEAGLPQIVSTCSVNHMTPAKSRYKPEYAERRKYDLDRFRTWIRHSPEELVQVARAFREKLNKAKGPVKVIVPLKGWSSVDSPGNATYDPEEDRLFVQELRKGLKGEVEVLEVDANMEDPLFAGAIVEACLRTF